MIFYAFIQLFQVYTSSDDTVSPITVTVPLLMCVTYSANTAATWVLPAA